MESNYRVLLRPLRMTMEMLFSIGMQLGELEAV
jgi:hypothetical protein